MQLEHWGNDWTREERNKQNNNLDKIQNNFNNVVETVSEKAYDQVVDAAKIEWVENPVNTFTDIEVTYTDPEPGDTVFVRDTGKVFRFNGTTWIEIQQIDAGPVNELDDRLSNQIGDQSNLPTWLQESLRQVSEMHDDYLRDIGINIKQPPYNAKGNGVDDDTQSIVNAITDAVDQGKNSIYIPAGVYIYEGFDISGFAADSKVAITGIGTLKLKDFATSHAISVNADNVLIKGIVFDGNKENQNENHRLLESWNPKTVITECTFLNAYDKQVVLERPSRWSIVSDCKFDGNGVVGNCNAITVRSSNVLVHNNFILNHGNGHGIITAYADGEEAYEVRNVKISNNVVDSSQHNAITIEQGSVDISIYFNRINNCPQAMKADHVTSRIYIIGNIMSNIHLETAFNLTNATHCIIEANELRDTQGGYNIGGNSIVRNNKLINSELGFVTSADSQVSGNYAFNVKGTPYRCVSGSITDNTAEECENTDSNYQFYIGQNPYPYGITFKGNRVINPIKGSRDVEAFTVMGQKWVASGNLLVDGNNIADVGFRVAGTGSDNYILKDNFVGDAVAPVINPSTDGRNVVIKDNI